MRDAFLDELLASARTDPNIMLVVGDLGFGVVEEFAQALPHQFLNAGVAEQNMVGAAAGLASTGYRVYVYSIGNFPTLRALEQIRNDVCYHSLDVTIVAVGAGVSYGTLGYTHHAIEDISVMRTLPGLRVVCPADPMEGRSAVHDSLNGKGPTYIRLGKNGEPRLHKEPPASLRRPLLLREGTEITIVGTGAVVGECLVAAKSLEQAGLSAGVWSCPSIKPLDASWFAGLQASRLVVTVEEHVRSGGFGSAVLEVLNDAGVDIALLRLGIDEGKQSMIGSGAFIRKAHGLDSEGIAAAVLSNIRG